MKDLDGNNHSVFSLCYILVTTTKHRQAVINEDISTRLKQIFEHIQPSYNIVLHEWGFGDDYIRAYFSAEPNTEISKFINAYKSASSRLIKKECPEIRTKLWRGHFWSKSFLLLTTGKGDSDVICGYIESQGENRGRR